MLDKPKIAAIFGISGAEYDDLLKDFVRQAAEKLGAVESALEAGDTASAAAEVHSLKGVCGNLLFDDCYSGVKALETALKKNDRDAVKSGLSAVRRVIEEIRGSLPPLP